MCTRVTTLGADRLLHNSLSRAGQTVPFTADKDRVGAEKSATYSDLDMSVRSWAVMTIESDTFKDCGQLFERVPTSVESLARLQRRPRSQHLTEFSDPTP